jgi:hypothetical protein
MTKTKTLVAAAAALLMIATVQARQAKPGAASGDRSAVEQAALDYVEAIYQSDPARIERSVHPQLTKRGFWRDNPTAPWGPQTTMTYDQLLNLAKTWNAKKNQDTSIKRVDIYEVLDQTASAKVTASWGIDYLHLAKYDNAWKIINIVWQAKPR